MAKAQLLKDAEYLKKLAEEEGVLAYLKRPSKRLRPNKGFLLSAVQSAKRSNRAREEERIWDKRDRVDKVDSQSKREIVEGPQEPEVSTSETGMKDAELATFLKRKKVRGRGGVGAAADEYGPFVEQREVDKSEEATLEDKKSKHSEGHTDEHRNRHRHKHRHKHRRKKRKHKSSIH